MRRSPTLAMVGGRCIVINFVGKVSSSSAQRSSSLLLRRWGGKEAQCVRRSDLQKGLSLGGRSPGAGVEVGDLRGTVAWGQLPVGQNIRGSIQFLMESWVSPTSSSPCEASSSSFQVNCSRSGSATHAAVSVLY